MSDSSCNICGSVHFVDFAGRPEAACGECKSFERTRALFHIIESYGLVRAGSRVLHFAPELGLSRRLKGIVGEANYEAFDIAPEKYPDEIGVKPLDIIKGAPDLPSSHYDLILHCHIMEHLPVWPVQVLRHLQRALKEDGTHLMCVPISPKGRYAAEFGALPEEERNRKFGQIDHFHYFGAADIPGTLGAVFNLTPKNSGLSVSPELAARHRFLLDEVERTMFVLKKADWALNV